MWLEVGGCAAWLVGPCQPEKKVSSDNAPTSINSHLANTAKISTYSQPQATMAPSKELAVAGSNALASIDPDQVCSSFPASGETAG
jgi:hypothetical protein